MPSEGHFSMKTIIVVILKCHSKPKFLKLAISKGPLEGWISKGSTNGHFGPPWSFGQGKLIGVISLHCIQKASSLWKHHKNCIYHTMKGTSVWKQLWSSYWSAILNQSSQNIFWFNVHSFFSKNFNGPFEKNVKGNNQWTLWSSMILWVLQVVWGHTLHYIQKVLSICPNTFKAITLESKPL